MKLSIPQFFGKKEDNEQKSSVGTFKGVTPAGSTVVSYKIDYKMEGYKQAGKTGGDADSYSISFDSTFASIKQSMELDDAVKQNIKNSLDGQRIEKEKELQNEKDNLSKQENKLAAINKEIRDKKTELDSLKTGKGGISNNPVEKLKLYVGSLILLATTIYLFVFYSSTIYSAFFRDFLALNPKLATVGSQMYDGEAIVKAFNHGIGAGLLTLLMPFIFLALGFLAYTFSSTKTIAGYSKSVLLYVITFAFDFLLAYKIASGLYTIEVAGILDSMPPFSLSIACADINMWIVIFGGFVAYIIWGLTFAAVMEIYQNISTTIGRQQVLKRDIQSLEKKTQPIEKAIDKIKGCIANIEKSLYEIMSKLRSSDPVYDYEEIKACLTKFTEGWQMFVTTLKKPALTADIKKIYEQKMKMVDEFEEKDRAKFTANNGYKPPVDIKK